ncbi:hypothetical protein B484DRAFT_196800 [Ochromonadaceae sp. CCMP2298]|nr:hypothetical protein B484DRAFT_196800 [Ochromonadaceae sp. CCMP2298]|mmetsp:Transcript_11257/g.25029  ORF Transcript_11257/g.25029 Transcript_11257/m.25029 type:complete len:418 (-) Transcript_11257:427-1680(-)|eukprot:CAMPEP_0173173708 /NCGR_PEP_ID=MMETSP1141-20130122/2972_1 /TAXON_ID=483371 /ORGANISM="non described non described, Strain CCMP2298" /LENGTH=417 /DNA_ID=CAMNT_0014095801 /DNA_START=141 /DNA_END=1394 /DNA_ORIENTATION=+
MWPASCALLLFGAILAVFRAEVVDAAPSNYTRLTDPTHENLALQQGVQDLLTSHGQRGQQLLCVTFIKVDNKALSTLTVNMQHMVQRCDWAVLFYGGPAADIDAFCSTAGRSASVIYCKRVPETVDRPVVDITSGEKTVQLALDVPKSALYSVLLPFLPRYESVFLMDQDISLVGFDVAVFLATWRCAFHPHPPPLVVQPLIVERTQYFPYVHLKAWRSGNKTRNAVAAGVGLVEQQVPFFNAQFFEWLVSRVLSQTREVALTYGVDQSLDRTWCKAADAYARTVLGINYSADTSQACAIIIGPNKGKSLPVSSSIPISETPGRDPTRATGHDTAVHHLNTRALGNKRANRALYREKGAKVNQHYAKLFPNWVLEDIHRDPNPLDKGSSKKFTKSKGSSKQCVKEHLAKAPPLSTDQ